MWKVRKKEKGEEKGVVKKKKKKKSKHPFSNTVTQVDTNRGNNCF